MKVIKGEKGKLPYGTYDKKENRKKLFFTILTAFIAVIIVLKLGELLNNVYISLLIVSPIEFLLLLCHESQQLVLQYVVLVML